MSLIRVLACLTTVISTPLQANILTGPATVIDGDTIDMTGTPIHLLGIDAPESEQSCTRDGRAWPCGAEATSTLREIIASAPMTCTTYGADVYGHTIATCETAVFDLGREMVRRGMALTGADAPADYAAATDIARQLQYGLWNGEFQHPEEWRAANPQAMLRPESVEPDARADRIASVRPAPARRYTNTFGCAIKGNRSRRGEWIYHLPGQVYYEDTRPEDLFCTEREAQAAGYRRSKE